MKTVIMNLGRKKKIIINWTRGNTSNDIIRH
jgi:hypothetical protein